MITHNITDYSQQKPKRPAVQIAQTARMTSKRRNNSSFHQDGAKTNTTRCNGHTITSSLQQRVTFPHKVQDNLRKPIQPDVMVAP